jgi:hypothetical protein
MDGDGITTTNAAPNPTLFDNVERIPRLVNKEGIYKMMDLQVATLDRLDCTNKSLTNCITMAQNKLASTTRLYKKTAKHIVDSKKDLDATYKKILDLKAKIRAEKPELFTSTHTISDQGDHTTVKEQNTEPNPQEVEGK